MPYIPRIKIGNTTYNLKDEVLTESAYKNYKVIPDGSDLNTIDENCVWTVMSGATRIPANYPPMFGTSGGFVITTKYNSTGVYRNQIAIKEMTGEAMYRWKGNDATGWSDWIDISTTNAVKVPQDGIDFSSSADYSSIADILPTSFVRVSNAPDVPEWIDGVATDLWILTVQQNALAPGSSNSSRLQMAYSPDSGNLSLRFSLNGGTYSNWVNVGDNKDPNLLMFLKNPVVKRNIASGNTTAYADMFPNQPFVKIPDSRRIRIVCDGLTVNDLENIDYFGLRLTGYDSEGQIVDRVNWYLRNYYDVIYNAPDEVSSVKIGLLLKGTGNNTSTMNKETTCSYAAVYDAGTYKPVVNGAAVAIRSQLPSYFVERTEISAFTESYIEEKIKSVPDGDHYLFCTDQHWPSNMKASNKLMAYVAQRLGIETSIFGGDYVDNHGALNGVAGRYRAYGIIDDFMNEAVAALGEGLLVVIGNHDTNIGLMDPDPGNPEYEAFYADRYIPWTYLNKICLGHIKDMHQYDVTDLVSNITNAEAKADVIAGFAGNYYVDRGNTRFIISSICHPYNGIHKGLGIAPFYDQSLNYLLIYDWMAKTLLSTPKGYNVIIAMHRASMNSGIPLTQQRIASMCYALRTKQEYNFTYSTNINGWGSGVYNESAGNWRMSFDFTGANDLNHILILGGDRHHDFIDVCEGKNLASVTRIAPYPESSLTINHNAIPIYTQTCDKSTDSDDDEDTALGILGRHKVQGTRTDQTFSVITLSRDLPRIYFTRFGEGRDLRMNVDYHL